MTRIQNWENATYIYIKNSFISAVITVKFFMRWCINTHSQKYPLINQSIRARVIGTKTCIHIKYNTPTDQISGLWIHHIIIFLVHIGIPNVTSLNKVSQIWQVWCCPLPITLTPGTSSTSASSALPSGQSMLSRDRSRVSGSVHSLWHVMFDR